jgi:ketosteroid isomerase-like protein
MVSPQGEIPPTGSAVELPFCAVSRVRSGRLAEVQVYLDQLTMLAQLNLIPAPAAA